MATIRDLSLTAAARIDQWSTAQPELLVACSLALTAHPVEIVVKTASTAHAIEFFDPAIQAAAPRGARNGELLRRRLHRKRLVHYHLLPRLLGSITFGSCDLKLLLPRRTRRYRFCLLNSSASGMAVIDIQKNALSARRHR